MPNTRVSKTSIRLAVLSVLTILSAGTAAHDVYAQNGPLDLSATHRVAPQPQLRSPSINYAYQEIDAQGISGEQGATREVDPRFLRTSVTYITREAPGTIIIDTANTFLYLVTGRNTALRYGVGVGREGFTWAGVQRISSKTEWPDWRPTPAMLKRQPYLPRFMAGGEGNPLGARAMYLGASTYRIHGTNDPSTIGKFVSSGCIRLTNADVEDLFNRVGIGAKVVVLPKRNRLQADAAEAIAGYSR